MVNMNKVKKKTKVTRLKKERLKKGLTQTQLAFFAELSASDISRFESGQMKPYPTQAVRLSRVLNIEPERLQELVEASPLEV
jgi:transcriptional regulator with XRE-family HTH domain